MGIVPDVSGMLDRATAAASVAGQATADAARTLTIQNQPLHGVLWEYIPPEQLPSGERVEGRFRLTSWGMVAVGGAGLLFLWGGR